MPLQGLPISDGKEEIVRNWIDIAFRSDKPRETVKSGQTKLTNPFRLNIK